jgi:hypothetical protein
VSGPVLDFPAMLAFQGSDTGAYEFVVFLHILSVILGIGTVMLNGVYAAQAQKYEGPPQRAIFEANEQVSKIAEYVIYTIPIWGIALVFMSKGDLIEFSDTWVWLSLVLFIAALGISHAVMIPGTKRFIVLLHEIEQGPAPVGGPPPQVAEIQQIGKKLGGGGAALNILAVVILALMIWKPGSPV